MQREKSIQIPQQLFLELIQYFILENREPERAKAIERGLTSKVDAMIKHELYTKYKTAPTPEQQEQARQEYLAKAGINASFRW